LKRRNQKAAQAIDCLLDDVKSLFSNKDDKFIHVLQQILNFSTYIMNPPKKKVERVLQNIYGQVFEYYLKGTNNPILAEF